MKFKKNGEMSMMEKQKTPFGFADPWPLQKREQGKPGYLKKLFLAVEPVMQKRFVGKKRKVIRNLLLDPAYQLK
ncbi:MAG: hypothetical protein HOG95_05585 [Rhodospirillaceae bacterium]|nr:hypothetical protein [Rhodospirillaceae bacterium]